MALPSPTKRTPQSSTEQESSPAPVTRKPSTPRPTNGHKPESGFVKAAAPIARRMIVSLVGEEKSGKTHTALTAPGPIYVHSFDIGLEGVVQKFQREKDIYVAEYELTIQPGEAEAREVAEAASKVWDQFIANYRDGLASCGNGTTVVDTDTEAWELLRLSRFGRIAQVMPHHYGPVNAEFRDFVREGYSHDANVFLLGKNVDEWENYVDNTGKEKGRKTGRKARKGFSDLPFLVQINALAQREGASSFTTTILDCRQNSLANEVTVDNDYESLAAVIFED